MRDHHDPAREGVHERSAGALTAREAIHLRIESLEAELCRDGRRPRLEVVPSEPVEVLQGFGVGLDRYQGLGHTRGGRLERAGGCRHARQASEERADGLAGRTRRFLVEEPDG